MAETHERRAREILSEFFTECPVGNDPAFAGEYAGGYGHFCELCNGTGGVPLPDAVYAKVAAALEEVERETARKCAEIAEAAFPAGCKGWRTAHNGGKAAAAEIRRKFGVEEMKTR